MAEKDDVFPQRNLPGLAENWGRHVENRIELGESSETQLEQKVDNGLRSTSGQLAVLSNQINTLTEQQEELSLGRRTHSTDIEDLSITATTPGVFPTATRTFSLPPPYEVGRSATLALSAFFERTAGSPTSNITVWIELLQGGQVVWRRTNAVIAGTPASAPSGWSTMGINDLMFLQVTNTSSATFTIRLYAHTFIAETVTATMRDASATISYSDPL